MNSDRVSIETLKNSGVLPGHDEQKVSSIGTKEKDEEENSGGQNPLSIFDAAELSEKAMSTRLSELQKETNFLKREAQNKLLCSYTSIYSEETHSYELIPDYNSIPKDEKTAQGWIDNAQKSFKILQRIKKMEKTDTTILEELARRQENLGNGMRAYYKGNYKRALKFFRKIPESMCGPRVLQAINTCYQRTGNLKEADRTNVLLMERMDKTPLKDLSAPRIYSSETTAIVSLPPQKSDKTKESQEQLTRAINTGEKLQREDEVISIVIAKVRALSEKLENQKSNPIADSEIMNSFARDEILFYVELMARYFRKLNASYDEISWYELAAKILQSHPELAKIVQTRSSKARENISILNEKGKEALTSLAPPPQNNQSTPKTAQHSAKQEASTAPPIEEIEIKGDKELLIKPRVKSQFEDQAENSLSFQKEQITRGETPTQQNSAEAIENGQALVEAEEYEMALLYLFNNIPDEEKDDVAWKLIGKCYEGLGRKEDAVGAYRMAELALAPKINRLVDYTRSGERRIADGNSLPTIKSPQEAQELAEDTEKALGYIATMSEGNDFKTYEPVLNLRLEYAKACQALFGGDYKSARIQLFYINGKSLMLQRGELDKSLFEKIAVSYELEGKEASRIIAGYYHRRAQGKKGKLMSPKGDNFFIALSSLFGNSPINGTKTLQYEVPRINSIEDAIAIRTNAEAVAGMLSKSEYNQAFTLKLNIAYANFWIEYYNNNYEEALLYIETFLSKNNVLDGKTWEKIAECYSKLGQYDKAIDAYKKASDLAKDSSIEENLLLQAIATEFERAVFKTQELLYGKSYDSTYYQNITSLEDAKKLIENGNMALQTIAKIPEEMITSETYKLERDAFKQIRYAKATQEFLLGNYEKAKDEFLKLKKSNPEDFQILIMLARCYAKEEAYGTAIAYYQDALYNIKDQTIPINTHFLEIEVATLQEEFYKKMAEATTRNDQAKIAKMNTLLVEEPKEEKEVSLPTAIAVTEKNPNSTAEILETPEEKIETMEIKTVPIAATRTNPNIDSMQAGKTITAKMDESGMPVRQKPTAMAGNQKNLADALHQKPITVYINSQTRALKSFTEEALKIIGEKLSETSQKHTLKFKGTLALEVTIKITPSQERESCSGKIEQLGIIGNHPNFFDVMGKPSVQNMIDSYLITDVPYYDKTGTLLINPDIILSDKNIKATKIDASAFLIKFTVVISF